MDDDGTRPLEDGDVAVFTTHQAEIHALLADDKRPTNDHEARMRWVTKTVVTKTSDVRAHLSKCQDGCKEAVKAYKEPGAAEETGELCRAMKRTYYKAMARKRQIVHKHYAQYMSMMPAHVGGMLILRGIAGSSNAVEEVHGCALRSEAGSSVMDNVNQLLDHYGPSLHRGETIAPFVSPDVFKLTAAVRELFNQIRERCPEDPDETTNPFLAIRGYMDTLDTFMKKMESGRGSPTTQSTDAQPAPAGLSAAADSPAAEPEVVPPAAPASQDDAGDGGVLEDDGDPEHGDVTEQPISASVNASASAARENMRRRLEQDAGPLEEIRQLSENGLSGMDAAVNASNDAKVSLTSDVCTTHVNRAQTAVDAVLGALSAARDAFCNLLLPQSCAVGQEHMNKLAEAAGTAEAAVADALAHQRELLQKEEEVAAAAVEAAAKLAEAEKAEAEKRQAEARKRPVVDDDDDDDDQPELKKLKATDYFTDERLGKNRTIVNVPPVHNLRNTLNSTERVLQKVPKKYVDAFLAVAKAGATKWDHVFERDHGLIEAMLRRPLPPEIAELWPRRQTMIKERGAACVSTEMEELVQQFVRAVVPEPIRTKDLLAPKEISLLRSAPLTRKFLDGMEKYGPYKTTRHPFKFPDPPPGEEGPWPSWQACHRDTDEEGWACIVALENTVWVRLFPKSDVFHAEQYEDVEIPAGHAFFFKAARRHAGFAMRTDSFRVHMQWDDRDKNDQLSFPMDDADVAKHFKWVDECAFQGARGGDAQ